MRSTSRTRRAAGLAVAIGLLLCASALASASASAAVGTRPLQEVFGASAKPAFAQLGALEFDRAEENLFAFDGAPVNEVQELNIEAEADLGGTFKLSFQGESTGWEGEATLDGGESGTGDIAGAEGTGDSLRPFLGRGDLTSSSTTVANLSVHGGAPEAGKPIEGLGIPAGTTIVSCSPSCGPSASGLSLSAAATATAANSFISTPTKTIVNLSRESGAFQAGFAIEGSGIPAGTTIVSCSPACGTGATELTLSEYMSDVGRTANPLRAGSLQITNVGGGPFTAGDAIRGTGIQPETTIESCSPDCASPTSLTISKPPIDTLAGVELFTGSLEATAMSTTSGVLIAGEQLSGTGILPGTIVTDVDEEADTFTLSQPPTANGTSTDLTADLPVETNSSAIGQALQKLPAIGAGNVGVTLNGSGVGPGFPQQVEFKNDRGGTPLELLGCDGSGLTGTAPTCTVTELQRGKPLGVFRYGEDGTVAPFSALAVNVIDGRRGPGGKPCAEEAASCDETPQGGLEGVQNGEIAVDRSGAATDGDVYVTQPGRSGFGARPSVIDIFAADGRFLGQIAGFEEGSAAEGAEKALEKACGVAVGPAGELYVADRNGIHKYVSQGAPHNPLTSADNVANFTTVSEPCSLAAGEGPTAGSLFAVVRQQRVYKLDASTGALRYVVLSDRFPGSEEAAVNPANGRLFVVRQGEAFVNEYDAAGPSGATLVSRAPLPAGATGGSAPKGIAVNPASGELYVDEKGQSDGQIEVYGAVAKPGAVTGTASNLSEASATLNGTVTPNGTALESCTFEWGLAATAYEHSEPCAESSAEIGAGRDPVPVHLDLSGLAPATAYHYRLLAANVNGTDEGEEEKFFTTGPPEIAGEWIEQVTNTEALLHAKVQARGFPTTYQVEYGTTPSYGQASGPKSLGFVDGAFHEVTVRLKDLSPGTTYHWRFAATNADPSLPGTGTAHGDDRTLATFAEQVADGGCANGDLRFGAAVYLPDCRAYELVSPLDKNGADVIPSTEGSTIMPDALEQSSVDGSKFTYGSGQAFADPSSSPWVPQYISRRDEAAGEWLTNPINPPRGRPLLTAAGQQEAEFKAFSPDLCQAWLRTVAEPPLSADALEGSMNLYRRTNSECDGPSYSALTTIAPPGGFLDRPSLELQGVSADGDEVIYATVQTPALPGTAAPASLNGKRLLYVQGEAGTRFVCIKPGGAATATGCSAGIFNVQNFVFSHAVRAAGAMSAEGSRIVWTEADEGSGPIYLRENPFGEGPECSTGTAACSIAVSADAEAQTGSNGARFWGAAKDGSRVIFSVGADLYEFVVEGQETNPIAGETLGVAGMSAGATKVYFASEEAIGGANAQGDPPVAGEPNLYLHRADGSTAFVARLAARDVIQANNIRSPVANLPSTHTARATANGDQLAFMSYGRPTGYDNTDAVSGEADAEVYLYDAVSNGGAGSLVCVSCNPSGARPRGAELHLHAVASGTWVAAQIPAWKTALFQPRSLSADGRRLFFESMDALSSRDTNGAQDVYQWEAPGKGSCTEGDPTFSRSNAGCVSLVSSGTSPQPSEFRDASPSGEDVFIGTASSLVPWDYGLVDVYDARVGGGLSGPPTIPAECEGEACQAPSTAPAAGAPASAVFRGPGNLEQRPPKQRCRARKRGKRRSGRRRRAAARPSRVAKRRCKPGGKHRGHRKRRHDRHHRKGSHR